VNNSDFVVHCVSNTFFVRSVCAVDCKKLFNFSVSGKIQSGNLVAIMGPR
jgi:hypothetical protein